MLNINESMWSRDSATTTTMAKTPNAWGNATTEMAIPRRGQFSTVANSNNGNLTNFFKTKITSGSILDLHSLGIANSISTRTL